MTVRGAACLSKGLPASRISASPVSLLLLRQGPRVSIPRTCTPNLMAERQEDALVAAAPTSFSHEKYAQTCCSSRVHFTGKLPRCPPKVAQKGVSSFHHCSWRLDSDNGGQDLDCFILGISTFGGQNFSPRLRPACNA